MVAFATKLSSYIRNALRQNSVYFAKKFPKWKIKVASETNAHDLCQGGVQRVFIAIEFEL